MRRNLMMRLGALLLTLTLIVPTALAATPTPAPGLIHDLAEVLEPEDAQRMQAYGQLLWDAYGIRALAMTVVGFDGQPEDEYVHAVKAAWALHEEDSALLLLSVSDQACTVELQSSLAGVLSPSERATLLEAALGPAPREGDVSGGVRDAYLALCDALAQVGMERQAESEKARKEKWADWETAAKQIRLDAEAFGKRVAESSIALAEELTQAGQQWWDRVKDLWESP